MTPARFHAAPDVIVREGGSDRPDWRRKGVCVTWTAWPWDPWYPDEHATSTDPVKRAAAWADGRALCASCPIRRLCLEDALAHESGSSYYRFGMRGQLDPKERANLARARQRRAKREAVAVVAPVRRRHVTHGTNQGYDAEMFNRDPSCALCKAAHAAKERAGRQERKAATA